MCSNLCIHCHKSIKFVSLKSSEDVLLPPWHYNTYNNYSKGHLISFHDDDDDDEL